MDSVHRELLKSKNLPPRRISPVRSSLRDLKMPVASASQFYRPAFEIFRDYENSNKIEDEDWDGDVFPNRIIHGQIHEPAPPYIVLVQGPPNVGKSLLIKSLVKHFNKEHTQNDIQGPIITITTGDKKTRLQFVECPDDINAMIDASKYADAVLLLVDASYGFEAETFEFLNLLRVHGFPKVMGVVTHLDEFKDEKELEEIKGRFQDHFSSEIYQGATLSYLSGPHLDLYKICEIQKLAEVILDSKFLPSSWRAAHPYVLVDRFEDDTPSERVQKDTNCDRNIRLYGYLRGCNIKSGAKVHIAGVGDFRIASVTSLADPFPLSSEMEEDYGRVDLTHKEIESFRTGTYLRLEVHDVPFGMVKHFNPCHPILVGGISHEEENAGYMQMRLKRHNWHMKLLKSRDPVIVSAGWRRYQTKPIYAMESANIRHQILKFTPEHNHCLAMVWGPLAPPLTRVAVLQSSKEVFRIAAKAVVLDPKPDIKIMKESKQKGTPLKIFKRGSALIDFTPDTEVSKYKGAPIQTSSGIRGQVKEAAKREGIAKCTFKKRICMSDIVFMRVLRQVEAPRFFNPLSAGLEPCDCIVPVNTDSLKKDDPAQRPLKLERRRGVEIFDGEPCSYSCSNPLTVLYNLKYMNKNKREIKKKKNAVMSKEEQEAYERGAEMFKRHQEEDERALKCCFSMALEDWELGLNA